MENKPVCYGYFVNGKIVAVEICEKPATAYGPNLPAPIPLYADLSQMEKGHQ